MALEPGIRKAIDVVYTDLQSAERQVRRLSDESRELADTVEAERLRSVAEVLNFALGQLEYLCMQSLREEIG